MIRTMTLDRIRVITAGSDPCPCAGVRCPSTRPHIPTLSVTIQSWKHPDHCHTSITLPSRDVIVGSSSCSAPSWNQTVKMGGRFRRVKSFAASLWKDVQNLYHRHSNYRQPLTAEGTRTRRTHESVPTWPLDPSVVLTSSSARTGAASPITGSVTESGTASLPPMKQTATRRLVSEHNNKTSHVSDLSLIHI